MRNDSPGGEGGIQASQHPKHAEPAQVFSSFVHLQELGEVGVHYRDGAADAGGGITGHLSHPIKMKNFSFVNRKHV